MQSDFEQYADEVRRGLMQDAQPPAEAPPMLSTISAAALQGKDIPPIRWIVENLIPAGLNILASPPKYGKSWAVLDLGLAVPLEAVSWAIRQTPARCFIWPWRTANAV